MVYVKYLEGARPGWVTAYKKPIADRLVKKGIVVKVDAPETKAPQEGEPDDPIEAMKREDLYHILEKAGVEGLDPISKAKKADLVAQVKELGLLEDKE